MVGSLGLVTVTTSGTPVRATTNAADPTVRVPAQSITVQPAPGNAGILYVGLKGMDITTGVGVLRAIPKPASATTGPFTEATISIPVAPAGLDASQIYLDSSSSGDKGLVSFTAL